MAEDDGLMLEVNHLSSVLSFRQGNLKECYERSGAGAFYCLRNESVVLSTTKTGGTHDGRVCCKVFRGLSQLLLGRDADIDKRKTIDWFAKANELTTLCDSLTDVETARVARAYCGLRSLLTEEYGDAREVCNDPHLKQSDQQQFALLLRLIHECARIGHASLSGIGDGGELLESLQRTHSLRKNSEYETLWLTFEGVAHCLCDDHVNAIKSLDAAVAEGKRSGELVFRPYTLVWKARVLAKFHEVAAAKKCLTEAANSAKIGGKGWHLMHYVKMVTAAREKIHKDAQADK
jgi:hypothetical protein